MFNLIKMHWGLMLYLRAELKKKRTRKELITFLRDLLKRYCSVMLQEYKKVFLLLDKNYRKQLKEHKKYEKAKKQIIQTINLLRYVKDKLRKAGLSRQRIKRFFIDLGSSDDEALQKLCDDLMREI